MWVSLVRTPKERQRTRGTVQSRIGDGPTTTAAGCGAMTGHPSGRSCSLCHGRGDHHFEQVDHVQRMLYVPRTTRLVPQVPLCLQTPATTQDRAHRRHVARGDTVCNDRACRSARDTQNQWTTDRRCRPLGAVTLGPLTVWRPRDPGADSPAGPVATAAAGTTGSQTTLPPRWLRRS